MALLQVQHLVWRKADITDISADQDPFFGFYGADLHQDQPPSYNVPPPSYDDVYTDLPPDYTCTDALACAKNLCASPFPPALSACKIGPMATPEKEDHTIDLRALKAVEIDWSSLAGIREQISKKQKKAQKAAQNVRG